MAAVIKQWYLRDGVLVALAVAVGAVDAISWLALGKVFTAFMTGNLAFLGFDLGGADGPPALRVALAIGGFLAGAWVAGRVVGEPNDRKLWPAGVTRALALVVALQGAFLVLWLAIDGRPDNASADWLVLISALAMGVQTGAIFTLGVRASFTTAATATLAVFAGDVAGWKASTEERVRLAAVAIAVVAGGAIGALLIDHARNWAPLFPLLVTAAAVSVAHGRLEPSGVPAGLRRRRGLVSG